MNSCITFTSRNGSCAFLTLSQLHLTPKLHCYNAQYNVNSNFNANSYSKTSRIVQCRSVPPSLPPPPPLLLDETVDSKALLDEVISEARRGGTASGLNIVAFSGGVDSSLAAAVAARAFGTECTRLCIGVSASLSDLALQRARTVARSLGIELWEVATDEGANPSYVANAGDACFFCKTSLYGALDAVGRRASQEAEARPGDDAAVALFNGTNADDLNDPTRLGLVAARNFRVCSPLARLTKAAVRKLARELGLPNWDWAASPCLRSRLEIGLEATQDNLRLVEQAEAIVSASLSIKIQESFRVRVLRQPEEGGPGSVSDMGASSAAGPGPGSILEARISLEAPRLSQLESPEFAAIRRGMGESLRALGFASVSFAAFRSGELSVPRNARDGVAGAAPGAI